MRRERHALLLFISLSLLVALLAAAGCRGPAPTPTPSTPTLPGAPLSPAPTTPMPTAPEAMPALPAAPTAIALEIREPKDESILARSPARVSGITALDAIVSVNGNIVEVAEDGTFSASVNLLEGPNFLEITASDYGGNQASKIITVIYLP